MEGFLDLFAFFGQNVAHRPLKWANSMKKFYWILFAAFIAGK